MWHIGEWFGPTRECFFFFFFLKKHSYSTPYRLMDTYNTMSAEKWIHLCHFQMSITKKKKRGKKWRWNSFWRLRLFFFTLHPVLYLPLKAPALDWALQEAFKSGPWTQALCGVFSTKGEEKEKKVEDKVYFSPSLLILFLSSKMYAAQNFFSWHNTAAL